MRLARRRQHETTQEFKCRYRWPAGVEATMRQYDRLTGVKHLRVRGYPAVRFAAVLKAAGVNIARAVAAQRASRRAKALGLGNPNSVCGCIDLYQKAIGKLFYIIAESSPRYNWIMDSDAESGLNSETTFYRGINFGYIIFLRKYSKTLGGSPPVFYSIHFYGMSIINGESLKVVN